MGNELITKDNKLISASYSLGVAEQRLIFLAIIEARKQKKLIDARGVLQIKASTYQGQFHVAKHSAYEALKRATEGLFEAHFEYDDIHEKTGKPVHHTVRWVQKASYIEEVGLVELQFTDAVIPLITRLSEQFTEYELKQVSELKSEYSIRLYELMMQWKSCGKTNLIAIGDLRGKLGLKPEQYLRMNNFKARVLDHSMKQINQSTNILASYQQHKEGRQIIGFTFKFKPKSIEKSNIEVNKLTAKQIDMFSERLASLPELGSKAPMGASTKEYSMAIAKELATSEGIVKYQPYLKKIGYKIKKDK